MLNLVAVAVANLYLIRVIPSEYLKVYLLSIGALNLTFVYSLLKWILALKAFLTTALDVFWIILDFNLKWWNKRRKPGKGNLITASPDF